MPSGGARSGAGVTASALLAVAMATLCVGVGGGCELAIPDRVPAFSCVPGPDSCPAGFVCAPSTGRCVAGAVASVDAGDAGDVGDSGNATDGGVAPVCRSLGCSCSGSSECTSAVCGDELVVTSDVYKAANQTSFCTKPCCTSADCDTSTVCFGTAAGGNVCVRPEWLGRAANLGGAGGGAACAADPDCRSGLCTGTSCADTCCSTGQSATECAAGTTCSFGVFPGRGFDVHYTASCTSTAGTGPNEAPCTNNSQCLANLCVGATCRNACRNSSDCSPGQECGYTLPTTSSFVSVCSGSLGSRAEGTSCRGNTDCQSGFCDSTSMLCTDVCYSDGDCTVDTWRCRPEVVVLAGGVRLSYLACGS